MKAKAFDRGIAPGFEALTIELRAGIMASLLLLKNGPQPPGVIGFDRCLVLRQLDFIETAKGGANVQATERGREALARWEAALPKR